MALALGWAGCTCAPTGARDKRYICTTDGECADGFFCDPSGECLKVGGATGGGAGGATGGGGGATGGGGGGGGASDDGGADAGVDAGQFGLFFTSVPQTVAVGACSAPVTFEVRNGGVVQGVPDFTEVLLSDTSNGELGLFSLPGCGDGGPLVLAPDASSGSFSFFGNDGGSFSLKIAAAGFAADTQSAGVNFPPFKDVAFIGAPQTVRAGDCSAPVVLELRDALNAPTRANAPVTVTLASTPTPGLLFYSDAICLTPVTQVTVPAGASRATAYAARETGRVYTMTADAGPGATAALGHTVLPMVRSGFCLIGDAGYSVDCLVNPAVLSLSDSFVVFQVGASTEVAGSLSVRCALTTLSNVHCSRYNNDSFTQISWQVAEVKGATVQRVEAVADGGSPSVSLATTAPPATSFILASQLNDGYAVNDNDFNIARLNAAGTAVDFDLGPTGGSLINYGGQVVTLPAIQVDRGNTSVLINTAQRTVSNPPPPTAAVALAQWRVPGSIGICPYGLRPEVSGKDVVLSRGFDAGGFCESLALPDVFYERVDFKNTANVQQLTVALPAGTGGTVSTLSTVDRTRTLVFAGGQSGMGQSLGEGTHQGSFDGVDYLGELSAQLALVPIAGSYQSSQLAVSRQSVNGGARWTIYVVELKP